MAVSYIQALDTIRSTLSPLRQTQTLALLKAVNRRVANPLYAHLPLPQTPISLKDGYAFSFSHQKSISLCDTRFISTGDALPEGMDTVVSEEEACIKEGALFIPASTQKGAHIKQYGEDIVLGETIIEAYASLGAYKITALAAQGISEVSVLCRPRVCILSLGKNIIHVGKSLQTFETYNSNALSIGARIASLGAEVVEMFTCNEETCELLETVKHLAKDADIVITTGGMSQNDAMHTLLKQGALMPLFHEVAITPARPSALSLMGSTPVLHLPGLPLSALLGFELLGVPLVNALLHPFSLLPTGYVQRNAIALTCKEECVHAIPGFSDGLSFTRAEHYEAGRLNALSRCNGYIRVEYKGRVEKDEEVLFVPFT